MQRFILAAAFLAVAPLAHAQSLGELGAAMAVHDAAAGAGMGSTAALGRVKQSIAKSVSANGNAWQQASKSEGRSSGAGWATCGGSSGGSVRGARSSNGWVTASAGRGSAASGWARRDSASQRRR